MCDIWKANADKKELSVADVERHVEAMKKLNVQRIVFSGGEALMHPSFFEICARLRSALPALRLTLLTTGLLLEKHAADVARAIDEITVSLDGDQITHDRIRAVPDAYGRMKAGIRAVRELAPDKKITGRSVVQRQSFRVLQKTIAAAEELTLDELSFLPVDVSSEAFNRPGRWTLARVSDTALSKDEVAELRAIVEAIAAADREKYGLDRIVQYFAALNGEAELPPIHCNAPWVSAVVEADGAIRPCFFHPAFGNVHDDPLDRLINSEAAVRFRQQLDMEKDEICRRCVCTLYVGGRREV